MGLQKKSYLDEAIEESQQSELDQSSVQLQSQSQKQQMDKKQSSKDN